MFRMYNTIRVCVCNFNFQNHSDFFSGPNEILIILDVPGKIMSASLRTLMIRKNELKIDLKVVPDQSNSMHTSSFMRMFVIVPP